MYFELDKAGVSELAESHPDLADDCARSAVVVFPVLVATVVLPEINIAKGEKKYTVIDIIGTMYVCMCAPLWN